MAKAFPDSRRELGATGAAERELQTLAQVTDAVYVLHCFQKKAQETSQKDIRLARKRYKELMRTQP